ncbi:MULTISPECIES: hypothetical protein [Rhodopseudomonas]|uniref:hypothetical protein n=1 Tax=Rhodopseudomonas TaxID=1073 RepID=UPI000A7FDDA6|nr:MULTISPECIES: hypothetical protein [Rhodopseudomonas]MDF3811087.1 hypothetical protein [Rhodopseudomonas sp. BAL398]WOK19977.1 hypothetical protein RBJ75_10875 [Rhodopseudomonas sp. BAL398]
MRSSAEADAAKQRARFMHPDAARWMRPDAARWIRPDVARFLIPGTDPAEVFPALDRKYSPTQPRVPAGNPDGGQWTDGGGGGPSARTGRNDSRVLSARTGRNDPRVLSDADPEGVKPHEQYAQARGRSGVGTVLINGQRFELTPAQGARLTAAEARADSAIARIREVDPNWKPPESAYRTPEGMIQKNEAVALAAEMRASELAAGRALPGPYSGESIPARGPGRNFTAAERREINRIGAETGCHSCGTRDPGTTTGNFYIDHQFPNAINPSGRAQRLFPHCISCSARQGPFVRDLKGGR